MKKLSRAKKYHAEYPLGRQSTGWLPVIGPFAIKTIIIKELGQEYNGLSTLFTPC